MKSLKDFDFQNKRVILRCGFNVPLNERGIVLDDFRIRVTIPTIKYLIKKGAKLLLMSHLGRPKGKTVEKLRLDPVAERLAELLGQPVRKLNDCIGEKTEREIDKMEPGEVIILENLRFYEGEKENDENFAKKLSKLGEIYINEAFSVCHRTHASIVGIPKYLPSGAGFLLEKEIKILSDLIENPRKPLIAIIGGKKVERKAKLIDKISEVADFLLIGGLIRREIKEKNIRLKYPQKIIEPIDEIKGKDIGPKTVNLFKEKISQAKTIFWNGPLGKFEDKDFLKGSEEIARAIVKSRAFSIAGGGETAELINELKLGEKFNHLSTGGGAMLAFLSGEKLPGIEALQ